MPRPAGVAAVDQHALETRLGEVENRVLQYPVRETRGMDRAPFRVKDREAAGATERRALGEIVAGQLLKARVEVAE